jgi:hypothetical protein
LHRELLKLALAYPDGFEICQCGMFPMNKSLSKSREHSSCHFLKPDRADLASFEIR